MNHPISSSAAPEPTSLPAAFDLLPTGDGTFRAVPQKPLIMASITQAARTTGLSRDTIYRLYKAGFVKGDQPSPKKIRIDMASLQTHRTESLKEGFWTRERRSRYLAGIPE
ncbi:MAG: hypothetical protein INR62_06440 [Rhodospirillales bacterium]|nr:hypothetical protein [Acetobacter sp.]